MQPETRQSLADVFNACNLIVEIAGPEGLGYRDSQRDALAIERLFEIIGEALTRIRTGEPSVLEQITDAHAIIGMRNVIAHGYDALSTEMIVETIRLRVPVLSSEAEGLLGP